MYMEIYKLKELDKESKRTQRETVASRIKYNRKQYLK